MRNPDAGVRRILSRYGRGTEKLPVYKMPHLRGGATAGSHAFLPAIGRDEVVVVDMASWKQVGTIAVHGQPVFVMARPDDGTMKQLEFSLLNGFQRGFPLVSERVRNEVMRPEATSHQEYR
jgi:protein NirF